jgi:hypothetical protein
VINLHHEMESILVVLRLGLCPQRRHVFFFVPTVPYHVDYCRFVKAMVLGEGGEDGLVSGQVR